MSYKLVVCGLYHYRHYARHLPSARFGGIVYSHKRGTLSGVQGKVQNLWLKEYLLNADARITSFRAAYRRLDVYHWLWNREALLRFEPAAVNLVMLQGTCLPVIRKIKSCGKLVVGEAVNLHPVALHRILAEDAKHHGVPPLLTEAGVEDKLRELPLVDFLLVPSEAVKQSYVVAGFVADRIRVIPYPLLSEGAAVRQRTAAHSASTRMKRRLAVIGQVSPRKGQYHLLRALAGSTVAADLEILMVGAADDRYLASLRAIGVPFQHISHLPHSQVLDLIASSAALVLNSLEDGFGMVVAEAVEAGTPVVVSRYAGAAETVQRDGGGLLVDPLDYGGVLRSIDCALAGNVPAFSGAARSWSDYAADVDHVLTSLEELRHGA